MISCYGCANVGNIKSDIIIATYPRSGSHFLQNSIQYSANTFIPKTHELINDTRIVSIVRDPIDSIASSVSMHGIEKKIIKANGRVFINTPYNGKTLNDFIIKSKKDYEVFYEYLNCLSSDNIIFKYEDLINNIDSVINFLCKEFDIIKNLKVDKKIIYNHIYEHIEKNGDTPGYSLTSKKNNNYEEIYKKISNSDLDLKKCKELYASVLNKTIKI